MSPYLTRRMLAIHVLGFLAVLVCVAGAWWQWERAHTVRASDIRELDFASASPARQFLPLTSIAMRTAVSGRWIEGWRLTVSRPADGRDAIADTSAPVCPWIVDALALPDGTAVAVVRGCGGPDFPAAAGAVSISGLLQPSEDSGLTGLPQAQQVISTSALVAQLGVTMHDGYLIQEPAATGLASIGPLLPVPVKVPLHWRNVVYVFNWIAFALIISVMWVRVVADEARDRATERGT